MTGNILTRHATRQKSSPDFCPYHDTKTEGCQDENINSPNLQNYLLQFTGQPANCNESGLFKITLRQEADSSPSTYLPMTVQRSARSRSEH